MDGDILFWIVTISYSACAGFVLLSLFLFFCCPNPVKKMHYYSSMDAISKWRMYCNINSPWPFSYHNREKFVFEPLYSSEDKKTNMALNGWTNRSGGSAHFFTQGRNIFDAQCRLLKKLDIPHRTLINGFWHTDIEEWEISSLDINADQDLETVWSQKRNRYCCLPRLISAFYTIEVFPDWCDENQHEAMCSILGIETKKTA